MRWSAADLRGTAAVLDVWWDLLTAGVPPNALPGTAPVVNATATAGEMEAALDALSRAGRHVAAQGFGAPRDSGTVAGIFTSDGGVPKLPVPAADVDAAGLVGDRQAKRRHHGRVWQALSLWSAEVVAQLQADGHPVVAGAAGENLSLAGLDWTQLRSGARLQIGDVLAEVSLPATPCQQIAGCFADRDAGRIGHRRQPGLARWYASVLRHGRISVGDEVVVEP